MADNERVEIDPDQILENEFRITSLELMLHRVVEKSGVGLSQEEVDEIRSRAADLMNEKYPEADLSYNP